MSARLVSVNTNTEKQFRKVPRREARLVADFGLGARWVASLFVVEYTVTTFLLKAPRQPPFGGWDSLRIDLMLLAASITVLLVGPGAFALESALARLRRRSSQSSVGAGRPVVT